MKFLLPSRPTDRDLSLIFLRPFQFPQDNNQLIVLVFLQLGQIFQKL